MQVGGRDQVKLLAWQSTLPDSGRFTHLTGAAAYGIWMPPLPADLPVFVALPLDESRPQRRGLIVMRPRRQPVALCREGLRVAPPAESLLACARDLELLDLVAMCDSALHIGACTLAELERAAAGHRRGAPGLRTALRHVDGRAESGWESMLRMFVTRVSA